MEFINVQLCIIVCWQAFLLLIVKSKTLSECLVWSLQCIGVILQNTHKEKVVNKSLKLLFPQEPVGLQSRAQRGGA